MRRIGLPEESFERKLKTFPRNAAKVEIAALLLKDADNIDDGRAYLRPGSLEHLPSWPTLHHLRFGSEKIDN